VLASETEYKQKEKSMVSVNYNERYNFTENNKIRTEIKQLKT